MGECECLCLFGFVGQHNRAYSVSSDARTWAAWMRSGAMVPECNGEHRYGIGIAAEKRRSVPTTIYLNAESFAHEFVCRHWPQVSFLNNVSDNCAVVGIYTEWQFGWS